MSFKINGVPLNITRFPDGTSQVWKLQDTELNYIFNQIEWDYEHEGEIVHLAQLVDLLRSRPKVVKIKLNINYLPYARQDKNVDNNATFALHSFAKLINTLGIDDIRIMDVHSKKATELIKNSKDEKPLKYIEMAIKQVKPDIICFPDAGAWERYKAHNFGVGKINAEKTRNQLTGELSGCKVNGEVKDKNILIVDDICDGGGTFINLAQELKLRGALNIDLYVTHGIFSKGLVPLHIKGKINRIFDHRGEIFENWKDGSGYMKEITYKPWEKM